MTARARWQQEGVLPRLIPIPGLSASRVAEDLHRIQRESSQQMEALRQSERRRRANDPHRCHCPFCTVIG